MIKKKKFWHFDNEPDGRPTKPCKPSKTILWHKNKILATIDMSKIVEEYEAVSLDDFNCDYLDKIRDEMNNLDAGGHKGLQIYLNCKPQLDYGGYCGFECVEITIFKPVETEKPNPYYNTQLQAYNKALKDYPDNVKKYQKEYDQWVKWKAEVTAKQEKQKELSEKKKLLDAQKLLKDNGFEVKKGNENV